MNTALASGEAGARGDRMNGGSRPPLPRSGLRGPFLVAAAALAVLAVGVGSALWPERTGAPSLVESMSSLQRNLGLALVVLVLPAAVLAAVALTVALYRTSWPRFVRAGALTGLWTAAGFMLWIWSIITVFAVLLASGTAASARAKSLLGELPDRVQAVPGVTEVRDAHVTPTDLASGHHVFLTAHLDPQLPAAERLAALDRVSDLLAERSTTHLRPFVEARIGTVAVGVSGDKQHNRSRLDLATQVSAATGAELTVVLWLAQGDELIDDDGRGVTVLVRSASLAPEITAAAAEPVVRARVRDATIIASQHPPGTPAPPFHPNPPSFSAAPDNEVRVVLQGPSR